VPDGIPGITEPIASSTSTSQGAHLLVRRVAPSDDWRGVPLEGVPVNRAAAVWLTLLCGLAVAARQLVRLGVLRFLPFLGALAGRLGVIYSSDTLHWWFLVKDVNAYIEKNSFVL